jgi:hypothetical protein
MQFDTLVGDLTVSEMLMYTAELKRPRSESREDKAQAVTQLIDRLVSESVSGGYLRCIMSTLVCKGQSLCCSSATMAPAPHWFCPTSP